MTHPKITNPPVVEFSLGVQFSRLADLKAAHLGRFWERLGPVEWPETTDEPPIPDQFESFEKPRWAATPTPKLRLATAPLVGRAQFRNASGERLVQLQPTRLHLNWLKTEKFKPSYGDLIQEFLNVLDSLVEFVRVSNLGALKINHWELTYVDAFFEGQDWASPSDWRNVLPGLFGPIFTDRHSIGLALDYRNAEWSFEIEPKRGRLHLAATTGKWAGDNRDALILTTTARGPLGESTTSAVREGLDVGHRSAVDAFFSIVSPTMLEKWR
jgi:uncharacterized protein (TIGR04255 family)